MATEDNIQILGVNRSNTTSKKFDFSNFEFVEQDSKPGFIAVLSGKGGPASVGLYKWFDPTGTQTRTSNVPYAKTGPKTSQAQAWAARAWPGINSPEQLEWLVSHMSLDSTNFDCTLFPNLKMPEIHDGHRKKQFTWTETGDKKILDMRARCTPHNKLFDRNATSETFVKFGHHNSFAHFLWMRGYPALNVNKTPSHPVPGPE